MKDYGEPRLPPVDPVTQKEVYPGECHYCNDLIRESHNRLGRPRAVYCSPECSKAYMRLKLRVKDNKPTITETLAEGEKLLMITDPITGLTIRVTQQGDYLQCRVCQIALPDPEGGTGSKSRKVCGHPACARKMQRERILASRRKALKAMGSLPPKPVCYKCNTYLDIIASFVLFTEQLQADAPSLRTSVDIGITEARLIAARDLIRRARESLNPPTRQEE